MNRTVAEELMLYVSQLGDQMTAFGNCVNTIEDEEERKQLKRNIGSMMVELYDLLTRPIVKQYPDMDPDNGLLTRRAND
jgi:hypothetical protein